MVPLRELLEARIEHERELRMAADKAIDHERELRAVHDAQERELRLVAETAVEKAREIQFDEYERRLNSLNHAHEQALEAQKTTVPRETFDNYVRETRLANELALKNVENAVEKRQVDVDRRLGDLEKSDRLGAGRRVGVTDTLGSARTLITIGLSLVGALLAYLAFIRPPA